jgi:hypothetical protein
MYEVTLIVLNFCAIISWLTFVATAPASSFDVNAEGYRDRFSVGVALQ